MGNGEWIMDNGEVRGVLGSIINRQLWIVNEFEVRPFHLDIYAFMHFHISIKKAMLLIANMAFVYQTYNYQ